MANNIKNISIALLLLLVLRCILDARPQLRPNPFEYSKELRAAGANGTGDLTERQTGPVILSGIDAQTSVCHDRPVLLEQGR
jgi:hypothetical protein